MSIEGFRDLVICISGLTFTVVIVLFAVLVILIYKKAVRVLDSIEATSNTIHDISAAVRDEVVKPIVQVAAVIRGISQGIDLVREFLGKKQ